MNKEEAKKQIYQALEIKAREDSHIIGSPYVSWVETADKIDAIIDSLTIDHHKVKLPQEVGEELEDYQNEDIDLLDYLHDVIDSNELRTTRVWMLDDREHRIGILADAYRYGWEDEPEAKWYVKTPEAWESEDGDFGWLCKSIYGGVDTTSHFDGEENEQFTRAEIKQYHLDSDIFTLVPVEEEK
jgi:hypothetical protein